jgi:Uma2 family endonuclease
MALTQAGTKPAVEYPSTDGEPMAQNTKQYRYITTIQGGLAAMFRDRPDVFVAGDLFWYPIEGDNKTRVAPDVMVVFGRPKGDRDSYRQWEEDNIAPQVVFEILSPSNTLTELLDKSLFYARYGVQEYYIYDPDVVGCMGLCGTSRVICVVWLRCGVGSVRCWGCVLSWRVGSWWWCVLMGSVLWGMRSWRRRWSGSVRVRSRSVNAPSGWRNGSASWAWNQNKGRLAFRATGQQRVSARGTGNDARLINSASRLRSEA